MNSEILVKLGCEEVREFNGNFEFRKSGFKFTLFHHKQDGYWSIGTKKFTDLEDLKYYISVM